jgi:hypothetical protein
LESYVKHQKKHKQCLIRMLYADKATLHQLSEKTGESIPYLIHRAVTQLNKQMFFEQMNAAYRDLRLDESAWQLEEEERALFEQASDPNQL